MYNYIDAKGIKRLLNPELLDVDISNYKMKDLYAEFSGVFIRALDTLTNKEVIIDITNELENNINNPTVLDIWLKQQTSITNTISEYPTSINIATYGDAFHSCYKIDLCDIGKPKPKRYPITEYHDLVITRPKYNTDLTLLHTHSLITVNGYLLPTDADKINNLAYVKSGADMLRSGNRNQMGMISFYNIGELTKIPIKDDMIASSGDTSLFDKLYVKTNHNLDNKSIIFVMCGYMIPETKKIMYRVNEDTICIEMDKVRLVERYTEARKWMDLSSLEIDSSPTMPSVFNIYELYNNETIRKLLTLPQSFVVLVDTPRLIYNRIYLRQGKLPGIYTTYHKPGYPLVLGDGRLAEYWYVEEDGHYSVRTVPTGFNNPVHRYTTPMKRKNIDDTPMTCRTYYMEKPYFLQIIGVK